MANGKQPPERYHPGNLPDSLPGLIQFLYDELWRIADAISRFPIGLNVTENQLGVPVTTIPTEFRLFEGVDPPSLDLPGGGWNAALGEWNVAVTGLYQVNVNAIVAPFGTGNKDYAAKVRLYIDDVERWANTDVGDDAYELSCSLSVSGLIYRESIVRITIELVHEQFVGITDVDAFLTMSVTAIQ